MSDLRTQLRRYLEETSVPVDVEEMLSSQTDVLHSVRPLYRWGMPRWAVGLGAAFVVILVVGGTALGIWLFGGSSERDLVQRPITTTETTAAPTVWNEPEWCLNPDCVEPVESGDVVRVSTVLGEMEWQRLVGQELEVEFDALNRSLAESVRPFGGGEADWESVGWPSPGWDVEARGHQDPAGPQVGLVNALGLWEPLVEATGVPDYWGVRDYWLVAGPAGAMLVGDSWGSAAPVGWVRSDEGRFELVGSLPFYPDFVGGWDGMPMVFPVADGFVGIGRQDPDPGMGEVPSPRPGQELWWSDDGRTWTLVDERPFGEYGSIYLLAGYGGRWVGLQTGAGSRWVWTSTDGRVWDRVGESPVRGGCWGGYPVLLGGERGWIAADCEDASVWLSVDGTEWQQLPNQDTIFDLYPSSEEAGDRIDLPVSLIGKDRTVLISADWGWWDTSVGWVGRFTDE